MVDILTPFNQVAYLVAQTDQAGFVIVGKVLGSPDAVGDTVERTGSVHAGIPFGFWGIGKCYLYHNPETGEIKGWLSCPAAWVLPPGIAGVTVKALGGCQVLRNHKRNGGLRTVLSALP